jgi:predicted NAD/FAD-binding protein
MPKRAQRVVIIGAGAAGLTAADTLRQLGYTNITILERAAQAGGKCCSLTVDGRSYELGAGILSHNNTTLLNIARRYHVPVQPITFGRSVIVDATAGTILPTSSQQQRRRLQRQLLLRYLPLLWRYRRLTQPGFTNLPTELATPFAEFAQRHHLELVANELAHYFTGFGYDYLAVVPAAYVLKYYSWGTLMSYTHKKIYDVPGGVQSLWITVARQFDIRYNTALQQVIRGDVVTLTTTNEVIECDQLIITSPLDEALQWLDASPSEKMLFNKIQYCDYRTYAVWLNDFPHVSGYLPGNYTASRAGHPIFWYQRYVGSNLYTFYILGDGKLSDDHVLRNITQLVQQLGGTVERTEIIKHWKYFPHITPGDLRTGYFDQLNQLQGQHHTYYAGELLNFSTVGLTTQFAEVLVRNFFGLKYT